MEKIIGFSMTSIKELYAKVKFIDGAEEGPYPVLAIAAVAYQPEHTDKTEWSIDFFERIYLLGMEGDEDVAWVEPRYITQFVIKDNGTPSDFPLPTIKKIKRISGGDWAEHHVNQLLSRGWVLLALEKKEINPNEQYVIFTLGHTDPSADDSLDKDKIYRESIDEPLD